MPADLNEWEVVQQPQGKPVTQLPKLPEGNPTDSEWEPVSGTGAATPSVAAPKSILQQNPITAPPQSAMQRAALDYGQSPPPIPQGPAGAGSGFPNPLVYGKEALQDLSRSVASLAPRAEDDLEKYKRLTELHLVRPKQGEMQPTTIRPNLLTPDEIKSYKIATGMERGAADFLNFFTSPVGIATFGIGSLPKAAQRAIGLAFFAQMAKNEGDIASQLGEQAGLPEEKRDYTKISELLESGAVNTTFATVAGAHGLSPGAKINTKFPVEWREIQRPTKGGPDAPEVRKQQQGEVAKYPGTETQRVPAETGGGNRPQPSTEVSPVKAEEVGAGAAARLSELKKISETRMLSQAESAELAQLEMKSKATNSREGFERIQRQSKQSEPVNAFENAVESPDFKGGNKLSTATGLGVKSVNDLDGLLSLQQKFKGKVEDQGLRSQLSREVIEVATDSGSWVEADIKPPFTKLGDRPLDWKKNPEIKDWLLKNGDKLWPKSADLEGENPNFEAFKEEVKKQEGGVPSEQKETQGAKEGGPEPAAAAGKTAAEVSPVMDWENPIQNKFTMEMEKKGNSLELPRNKDLSPNPKALSDKGSTYSTFSSKDGKVKLAVDRTELYEREGVVWRADPSEPINDGFVLEIISTDPSVRGMGKASQMMKDVIDSADASGAALYGEVAPVKSLIKKGQKGLTRQQLFKWYESLGFKKIGISLVKRDPISKSKPEPVPAGPGAAIPPDVGAKAELAQLEDSLKTLAQANPGKPELNRSYTLGEKLSQFKDPVLKSISGLKAAATKAKISLQTPSVWNDFKGALGQRQLSLTESAINAKKFQEAALRAVPKALDREAISNWIDHGGDRASILRALSETDPSYEPGYQRALSLPPELETVARNIQNYFESRLQDAQDAGILEDGIENYIHRLYEKDSPWKQGVLAELRSGVYTGKPSLARNRVFQYDYEAEKAGYKPVKDFVRRVAEYDLALNKAIADRKFVEDVKDWKMPDNMSALQFIGTGTKVGGVGSDAAYLIKPRGRGGNEEKYVTTDGRPYVPFDHPALKKWKWTEETPEGSPILVSGEALVHPDALKWIKGVFGQSKIRQYALGRATLKVGSTIKQTMLDLSGFHPAQITIHGWEHRADVPFSRWTANLTGRNFKEINLDDPTQRFLVSHGLVVADPYHYEMFGEGLSGAGSSLLRHVPFGIGEKLQQYNRWLFQDYIPRLKMEMATKALERNREAYAKDLQSGKMTEDQLGHLTANQANAAFGELNYEMLGRSKTTQDIMRIGLLAPDFLEARARFAAQAGKTILGGYGREQLTALGLGAITMYVTARILNKVLNGQWHMEPEHAFDVLHNGRAYSVRTVQGDILHAIFNPRSFIYTRLNPVTTRTAFEAMTGRDQFGRPRTPLDQMKDFASTIVPISLRGLVRPGEQKLWESALNAFGVTERRATATDHIFKIVDDFKKKHGITEPGEFIYDPDKDPYRAIKIALLFGTPHDAAQEIKLALDKKLVDWQHMANYFDHFGTRPFTGSKKNENLFWNTLSADQKTTYQEALKERAKMRSNAREAFKLYRQDFTPKTTAKTP